MARPAAVSASIRKPPSISVSDRSKPSVTSGPVPIETQIKDHKAQLQARLHALHAQIGRHVVSGLKTSADGAPTSAFAASSKRQMAPLTGLGYYRVGEDGRLYVIAKSEHYHVSLGHGFPGYVLLGHAQRLGVSNATHNNTRGWFQDDNMVVTAIAMPNRLYARRNCSRISIRSSAC